MTIKEMEIKLEKDGMLEIHMDGVIKKYVSGDYVYKDGAWENHVDVFGIYIDEEGMYNFFVTDSERGIGRYGSDYEKEEEACDELIRRMYRNERIYKKNHN